MTKLERLIRQGQSMAVTPGQGSKVITGVILGQRDLLLRHVESPYRQRRKVGAGDTAHEFLRSSKFVPREPILQTCPQYSQKTRRLALATNAQ